MSDPVVRASLSSNYFLNCFISNAVSKESSLKILFGYFKMSLFFYFKFFKGKWLQDFVEIVIVFISFSFTRGIGHCTEGWKPKPVDHLDCFDAAFAPALFRCLYTKLP